MRRDETEIALRIWVVITLSVLAPLSMAQESKVDTGAQVEPEIETLFKGSLAAAEAGRLGDAIQAMERVRSVAPDHADVLWNLGLWYSELGDHESALEMWTHYRGVDPGDWQARAKLIQTFQALGWTDRRDAEREALMAWYSATSPDQRPGMGVFCREQFAVGETRVMAFEFFEPAGDLRRYYRFTILDADGDEDYRYSLGSYETATLTARETGRIGSDQRLYHLDRYDTRLHSTVRFYQEMPDYEDVRRSVVLALQAAVPADAGADGT